MSEAPLTHPDVRNLAWSLGSPPLLLRGDAGVEWPDDAWYTGLLNGFMPRLRALDAAPEPLLDRLARSRDRRLGRYFEILWQYWLEQDPRYELLFANLPVRDAGRTLGEFDLIVRDRRRGTTEHWEIALKFYLGQGDTAQPGSWWGPARRDRLDRKTARLLQHQCRLSGHPQAREQLAALGVRIDVCRILLKGRLFYPYRSRAPAPSGSNPAHLRGEWIRACELASLPDGNWLALEKHDWLAPLSGVSAPLLSTAQLRDWWHSLPAPRPVCVAGVDYGTETGRLFLLPDDREANAET